MSDVNSVMMEAETALNEREWDLAIDKYKEALGLDPQNEEACTKLAEVYAVRGLVTNVVETYFNLMEILEQKQNYDMAVEVARWIMKVQPENDKARMKTILIYKKKGDMDEVVNQSLQLARLYIELNQGDQSILLLKNAQEIAPDNLYIGLELAEMYISHGHIQEGTNQYRKIANAYLNKGDYEKAAEAFRRMKVVIPEDPQLLFTLGNLYMNLGKFNEAEAEFRAILRHNLNHTDALMSLGEVCQKKGQFRDAILAFNKILSINPQDEKAKERLGELHHASESPGEAVKFYLEAANAYQYNENIEKAIMLYQRVLSIDTSNPTACRELTNLGAPLEAEGAGSGVPKDTSYEVRVPAESVMPDETGRDDIDLDLDDPYLEEIAGIEMPGDDEISALDEPLDLGGLELEGEDTIDEFMPREAQLNTPQAGAVPSAFGSSDSPDVNIRELKKGYEGELTYNESNDLSPDLMYDDDMNLQEEEMGFSYDQQDSEEEGDYDYDYEEEDSAEEEAERRGLRRKDEDDSSLRRGLSKKKALSKRITSKRAGVVSTASSVKKPSLPKRGLASKGKGLFRRRRQEEQFEEEVQPMEFPEPEQTPPLTMGDEPSEMFDDFEAPPAFDEEGFSEAMDTGLPAMDEGFGDLSGMDESGEYPPMGEEFPAMDSDLPLMDEGFGDLSGMDESGEYPPMGEEFPAMNSDLPAMDEGFGVMPGMDELEEYPSGDFEAPLGEGLGEMSGMDELGEYPPMGEEFPAMDTDLPSMDEGFGEMPGMDELGEYPSGDQESSYPYDENEDMEQPEAWDEDSSPQELMPQDMQIIEDEAVPEEQDLSGSGPESGLLGMKKKKSLRSLFTRKQLKKEFPTGKKISTEKLLGGRKYGGDGETLGQKRLLRRSRDEAPEEELEMYSADEPLSMEPESVGTPSAFEDPSGEDFLGEDMSYDGELSYGADEDHELSAGSIPDFESEFDQPEALEDDLSIYPEVDDLTDLPEIHGFDDIQLDSEMTADAGELPPMEIPDLEIEEDTSFSSDPAFDTLITEDEEDNREIMFTGDEMAQTLESLEGIDTEDQLLPLLDEYGEGSPDIPTSKPTSFLGQGEVPPAESLMDYEDELDMMMDLDEEEDDQESDMPDSLTSLEEESIPPAEVVMPEPSGLEEIQEVEIEVDESSAGTDSLADFGDLLKLAQEIENIIPDEDRLKEVEEQRRQEEELRKSSDEHKAEGTSELETENQPAPTSFLEGGEPSELTVLEDEIDMDMVDQIGELDDVAIDTDTLAINEVTAPVTNFLQEEEIPQSTGFLDGVEGVSEIELGDESQIVESEMVEEIIMEPIPQGVNYAEELEKLIQDRDISGVLSCFDEAVEKTGIEENLLLEYGELCYDYGLTERALDAYQKTLENSPGNYNVHRNITRTLLMEDQIDNAVESLVNLGDLYTGQDNVEEAQRVFQHVLALQKNNSHAREALSEIYLNLEMKQLALYHLNILAEYLEEQDSIDETIKVLKKIYSLTNSINTQEKLTRVYLSHNFEQEAIVELEKLAGRYLELDSPDKAAIHYENIVSIDDGNISAHQKLMELYDVLNRPSDSYRQKVRVADLMVENEDLQSARGQYEECLKIDNSDNEVRRKLVEIYLGIDETDAALEESKSLANVYHKKRQYDEAIELFNALVEQLPRNLLLREKLSEFYILSDQFDKGLEQLVFVAEEQSRQREWDAAIKTYRKALTIDTRNADFHYRIGEIFLNYKKNNIEARYEFEKVFEIDNTHRKAMEYLVNLFIEEDRPGRAISILKDLIEIDNSYSSLRDEIIEKYKGQIEENPDDYKAHFNLGVVYKELQMWKQAIEQFQTTRKSKDFVLESHNMLGISFAQQPPMLNLAVKTLEKGLELKGFKKSDYVELHYNLGTLYEKMGRDKKAAIQYEAVLSIDSHYQDTAERLNQLKKKVK